MTDKKNGNTPPLGVAKKVGMGGVAALMVLTMGYDYIAPLMVSQPIVRPSDALESALFETPSRELDAPVISTLSDLPSEPAKRPPPEKEALMVAPSLPPVMNAQLILPERTQRAIQALEAAYQSGLQEAANQAKLKEKVSRQELTFFSAPSTPVKEKEPVPLRAPLPQMQADALQLKSIVLGADHRSAWFSLGNELFPVKVGAWIGDLKVHRLQKTHVLLLDKSGKEYTKYVKATTPIVLEDDNDT